MPSRRPGRDSIGAHLVPRHKVWLTWDGRFLMGPNYLRFLEGVERTGTIRGGGEAAGWSYRTCLNRVRRMEQALGTPILLTTRGGAAHGGAQLTPAARELVRIFAAYREEMHRVSDRTFRRIVGR
ncbi:MAG TPA: LysR family transcriptional regulator [Gemmatimonadales bacterium]|nr:LysR family transcriptional regulator [Gemmatimonadales bacterium]